MQFTTNANLLSIYYHPANIIPLLYRHHTAILTVNFELNPTGLQWPSLRAKG